MKRIAIMAALAALLLSGCNEQNENKDPRDGVVYLEKHNCFGECFNVTKICLGPDLIYRDTRLSPENRERVIKGAPECEVR